MRRREFITLLGGTAAAWPISAYAQPAKLPTIGFLGTGAQSAWTHWTAAFVQRLHELGWIEGRTVAIEYRWAEGRTECFREIAAEFARLKVAVIVTAGGAVNAAGDIGSAFEALGNETQALYVCASALVNANIVRINTLALGARLPTISSVRGYVEAGGLMSYGANTTDLFRRAGEIVDKILKGAKPADLPVEQPTAFELVINLTTAQALGLKIPEAFLLRADAVIE
jgi:hypothetical protein